MHVRRPAVLLVARADGVGGAERRSLRQLFGEVTRLMHPVRVGMAFLDRAPKVESVAFDLIRQGHGPVFALPLWLADDYDARIVLPGRLAHFPDGDTIALPALGSAPTLLRLIRRAALDLLARRGCSPASATLILGHPGHRYDRLVAQSIRQAAQMLDDMHGFRSVEAGFLVETPRLARLLLEHPPPILVAPMVARDGGVDVVEDGAITLLPPIGHPPAIGGIIAGMLRGRLARVVGATAQ